MEHPNSNSKKFRTREEALKNPNDGLNVKPSICSMWGDAFGQAFSLEGYLLDTIDAPVVEHKSPAVTNYGPTIEKTREKVGGGGFLLVVCETAYPTEGEFWWAFKY